LSFIRIVVLVTFNLSTVGDGRRADPRLGSHNSTDGNDTLRHRSAALQVTA